MYLTRQTSNRLLLNVALICLLGLSVMVSAVYAAPSKLEQIRCHRYEEGGIPVRIRLSLDFNGTPERLVVKEAENPFEGVPVGFLKDLKITTENKNAASAVSACPIVYGNTDGSLNITFAGNEILLAALKGYQLMKSDFNYLDESNVAYVDLSLKPRAVVPTKPSEAKIDTVYIEKIVHDTLYIEKQAKTIHDTVYVDRFVYLDESKVNVLKWIKCRQSISWWKDPLYKIDFKFSKETQSLTVKEYTKKLPDMPEGYIVKYVIQSEDKTAPLVMGDVDVDYGRGCDKFRLMPVADKCYLLFREGADLKPQTFTSDRGRKQVCLRLN